MTSISSRGGQYAVGDPARVLRIARAARTNGDEQVIDLDRYSHLDLFSSAQQPAQYDSVLLAIDAADRDKLRPLLRDIDWLLTVGGRVELLAKGGSEWAHFVVHSLLASRYTIAVSPDRLTLVKQSPNPAHATDNSVWSIAVMSNGNNEARILRLVESIERQAMPQVELVIVGPPPKAALPVWARTLTFDEHTTDPRFAIAAKKNRFAAEAQHENLLILHDRYRLAHDWYANMMQLRAGWEALAFPTIREGQPESTLDDWVAFTPPTAGARDHYRLTSYQDTYPADFRRLNHATLPYAAYSDRMTMNGGAFAVKRALIQAVPLDVRLHWAEIEDGDWSERLVNHGAVISLAHNARVENLPADTHGSTATGMSAAVRAPYTAARAAVRSAVFKTVGSVAQKLGKREDLFRTRGVFSNEIAPFPAEDVLRLPHVAWPVKPAVFVRGNLEKRLDLRALLEQIRRYCPAGSGVYFELATTGVGYFTRGTTVRNCEVLMYEVSLVLGDDFELRSLFCSAELSFLVHLVRTRAASVPEIAPLMIIASDDVWATRDETVFAALDPAWRRSDGFTNDAIDTSASGTILLLRDMGLLGNVEHWRTAYKAAGFVVQHNSARARVLQGNVLCSRAQWRELCDGRDIDIANMCDLQRAEITAILRGRWPAQLSSDGSFR